MLAVNVSNPDRPHEDQALALTALAIAKDTLNYFGASHHLNCRIWVIFGKLCPPNCSPQALRIRILEIGRLSVNH
jgi:hypothetical protein